MSEHRRKALFPRRVADSKEESRFIFRIFGGLRWNRAIRYVMLIAAVLIISLLFPRASNVEHDYELNSVWSGDTIRAPFAFPLYKDRASYEQDVKRAQEDVLPIYVPTGITALKIADTLHDVAQAIALSQTRPPFLNERTWAFVQALPPDVRVRRMEEIASTLATAIQTPYNAGVISRSKASMQREKITIRLSEVREDVVPINTLYDSLGVAHTLAGTMGRSLNPEEFQTAITLLGTIFTPTYVYSARLTDEARETAKASVPQSLGVVADREVIVANGERITETVKLKLNSFERSRQLREEDQHAVLRWLGNLGHVALLVGLAGLFLYNFRRRIFHDNLQIGIILSTLVVVCFMSYLSLAIRSTMPIEFLVMMPFLAMLFAILFDSRTAFYLTVTGCFLVAGVRGNDYSLAIACLSAGVMAAYTVRDIKSRTQLFRSIGFSMLGFTLAILALGLERGDSLVDVGIKLGFAAINATVSPVITFGVIWAIESLFGVTTDLKLLEYDNLSHPLLRALADKAPGTYQHTLTIARLAESAANAIEANGLLAKVGSYFHDVGKVAKAEYFVENQMQMGNKHDRIKPEMSAKIIRNHVQDGIELAREYHLPQRIIDFIPMHHGTTVIKYFLDKARETNPDAKDDDYRYPGPKPQSRETAIVMLADAVEATTRALPNPTPKAIEETIDRAIKRRFSEGQLDHCELSLADLNKIKIAFMKNLIGMSHSRIQYKPDEKDGTPEPALQPEKKVKQDPVIPYIDDAFGSVDAEIGYGKQSPPKRPPSGPA
ncbi:MAG: HDIG domain-containing metalloprotein [Candidatus Kapaibacterium sp.]